MLPNPRAARALLAACLLAAAPVFAQEVPFEPGAEQPPLLEMLALAPDVPEALNAAPYAPFLGYVDYRAIEQARPGVPTFPSWADYEAARAARDTDIRLWSVNSVRIQTGQDLYTYLERSQDSAEVVGFDLFDVDRALTFGRPPAQGRILQGRYDAPAIEAAHVERGYVAGQNNGVVLLQRGDGEPGNAIDVQGINLANPFGGEIGRMQPLAVTAEYLLSTPNDTLFDQMVNSYVGYAQSLYTRPELVAAAEAVSIGHGELLQALFYNPAGVGVSPADTGNVTDAYGPLPAYQAAVVADLQDGHDQIALIALVYENEATARAAAAELTDRVAAYPNVAARMREPAISLEPNATVEEANVYYSPGTGLYVALASVRYLMPPNLVVHMATGEPLEGGIDAPGATFWPSGHLFRVWADNLEQQTFTVLLMTDGVSKPR